MSESKTYVFGNEGSGQGGMMSLLAPLLQQRGLDPNLLLAMNKYDWDVRCFIGYGSDDAVYLCNELMTIGCGSEAASKAYRHFIGGGESRGLTYSNVKDKVSVVTIGHSEEESEMVNTIGHELLHVTAHICEAYDIDMSGEQACYIMGELCEKIFNFF